MDEALAIINRELEAAFYSKYIVAHTEARLHVAEQDLAIERGKAVLATPRSNQNEVQILKDTIQRQEYKINKALEDYEALKAGSEKNAKRVEELEDWKRRMKMMVDGILDP